MDGSNITKRASVGLPWATRDDALFRIVYFGEALRAMTEHVSDALISGPCEPMIDVLDDAFDRMSEVRPSFSPEEFTLYVMSRMLGLCEDDEEARQFRIGAAQYIVKSAKALPEDYAVIVEDAERMLADNDVDENAAQAAIADARAETQAEPSAPSQDASGLAASAPLGLEEAVAMARAEPAAKAEARPLALRKAVPAAPVADTREAISDTENRRPVRIRYTERQGGVFGEVTDKIIIGGAVFVFLTAIFLMAGGIAELPGVEIFSRERVGW
ncbi:hypothetical protein N8I71_09845 [Roseibacterium sp. SDUM158016]|uniref:hypothetical protein n=1 Tax=Roseicyclus sediminis TaxID=2980997 RepID=UPI0021D3CE51|nr:hypothetical protein [Roseibacterium sp. SDUM158016]MCU4653135.1 hypothetical protein [Roseibacterium sp. SDUM158016]